MRKRHVRNRLDFRHLGYSQIGLPLVESIQRIMIRAEIFGQTLPANRSMEHPAQRHPIHDAAVDAKPNHATRTLVHYDENPMCSQCGGFAAEQIATPQTILRVAEKREPGWTSRFRPVMNAQDTANHILIDLDGEGQHDLLGNSGTALGLRRFISTTASMSSFFGPFGPGRRQRWGENNMRYFRLLSTLWRCSRVEVFRTMAERRTRAGRMKRVHKPATIRSAARGLGARLRPRLRIRN